MTSALQKAAMRVMEAWDETVLPKARDGMTQERMEELRAALAEQAEQEAVAAQHRFRHLEKGTPDWSVWQPCKINNKRPAHEIDSGYQVEYRALYTAPQPAKRQPLTDEFLRKLHHIDEFGLFCDYDDFEQIARAIEAAHGIKENT